MLSYNQLKERPRDFFAVTGRTGEEFTKLLPAFEAADDQRSPPDLTRAGKPRQRRTGGGVKGVLPCPEEKLLFMLASQKTNPLQTLHGLPFGLRQPQTHSWIHQLLPVLQHVLADLGMKPEREASRVTTSPLALEAVPDLAIDGTERQRQRPTDAALQREHSSGKKKAHTDKHILLVNETTGKVVSLGPTEPGKTHDKKAAD